MAGVSAAAGGAIAGQGADGAPSVHGGAEAAFWSGVEPGQT